MNRKFFAVTAFLAFACAALAQEKKNIIVVGSRPGESAGTRVEVNSPAGKLDDAVTKTIENFFAALRQNQIAQAYEDLTKGTKIAENPKDIATLKSKTQQAIEMFGDIVGAERTAVQNVGTHLLRTTYVSLGKNFPLRWRFYFYRAGETWRLIDIRVDDRLADMFDEPEKTPAQSLK